MKSTLNLATLVLLGPPVLLTAGEVTTYTPTYETAPPVTEHQGWFFGAGADYMTDADETFYNAHIGYDFGAGNSIFLESGWFGAEERPSFLFPFTVDVDIVPITLNYKYEYMFSEVFGVYLGFGAGASRISVDVGFADDDDWVFTAQAFAGVIFNVTPNFEVYAGARYMWLDDMDLFGADIDDLDDIGVGAGFRFNF